MKHLIDYVDFKGKRYYVSTTKTFDMGLETMIFKIKDGIGIPEKRSDVDWMDLYCEHYNTWEEAEAKHKYIVNHIEKFL